MLKESHRAILVYLGGVVLISCVAAGCSPPKRPMDLYLEAVALAQQGQHKLAIERFGKVIAADLGFVQAYSGLGQAYLATQALDEATWAFACAAAQDPWSFPDLVQLASIYEQQGKSFEAAKRYARAAELAPEDREAQCQAAECYLRADKPVRALTYAKRAKEVDEPSPAVLQLLGRAYEAQGNYQQAVATYKQWADMGGDAPDAMLAIAVAHIRNGKYDKARAELMTVLDRWPREAAAYRHLAYCFLKLGETDRAIEMYRKAIELKGDDWEARQGLGVACMVKSRRIADSRLQNLALQHWREALAICPDRTSQERLQRLIKEHSMTTNPLQGLDY